MRRPLRVAAGAMALASACFLGVASVRWWPCGPGALETTACGLRQDDSYDAALRAAWPASPELWALIVAYASCVVAVALVGYASGRRGARWASGIAALPALMSLVMYVPGLAGLPGAVDLRLPYTAASLALGPLAYVAARPLARRPGWPALFAAAMAPTALLVDFFSMPLFLGGYWSWDTNPWTWTPSAVGAAAAAFALARLDAVHVEDARDALHGVDDVVEVARVGGLEG